MGSFYRPNPFLKGMKTTSTDNGYSFTTTNMLYLLKASFLSLNKLFNMKFILSILVTILTSYANCQTQDTLTNADIIQLSELGLQPSVIILKIQNSNTKFDVSTNELINLNKKKIPSEIIAEMIKAGNKNDNSSALINNKITQRGIYSSSNTNSSGSEVKIDAMPTSREIGAYRGKSSTVLILAGAESSLKMIERRPTFHFYFSERPNGSTDLFSSYTSPKSFILVKFLVHRKQRVLQIASMKYSIVNLSISDKVKVPFEYTSVGDGVYKISLKEDLKPGEYGFLVENEASNVFDFSIQKK